MVLRLEAIKFNHDTSRATIDAINIRRNETEFVNVPEWRRGLSVYPEDSPAAYAIAETSGSTLTVEAQFSCASGPTPELEVRALDARLNPTAGCGSFWAALVAVVLRPKLRELVGNVLGEVAPRLIPPCAGTTSFETFKLKDVRIWEVGVGVQDIEWRWQYRLSGADKWTDFDTSKHRIYTTLTVPAPPWQQKEHHPTTRLLPWAEALDRACVWAAGAKNADEAAHLITHSLNSLGPTVLRYKDLASFTDDLTFNCQAFLHTLQNQAGKIEFVNCDDCAAIVSTFANILGCNLTTMSIEPIIGLETLIPVKPIILIGDSGWKKRHSFTYHAVASEGSCCREEDEVFDACLHVAAVDTPTPECRVPLLPTNLRFGLLGESFYRSRLVLDESQHTCQPDPEDCRLKIPAPSRRLAPHCQNQLNIIKERHGFDDWARDDEDEARPKLFIFEFFFADYILPDWGAIRLRAFADGGVAEEPPTIQAFWKRTEKLAEDELLRVDVFDCATRKAAREGVAALLTWFQEPGMERRTMSLFGDVVFADDAFSTILLAAGNLVFFLRHADRETGSLENVAESISRALRNPPPEEKIVTRDEQLFAPGQFGTAGGEFKSGDRVPLLWKPEGSPARRRLYQFFTRDGEVSWEDGVLVYRPLTRGLNTLEIFAAAARGDAVRQELHIEIH